MSDNLQTLFLEPTAAYRGKPFWSWNGKLEKEELLRQIHIFKEMGFGGFFMHSRTGLVTEYLGDEWFELINACAEEAERLGLEAWLYDEDRWPSGTAGGLVTEEPRYRLKFMRLRTMPAADFAWRDEVFAAFSCRLEGLAYTDCRQLTQGEAPVATDGLTVLAFSIVEQKRESFYNGYTYLDTMNREAVERFLELTHEKYRERCGKHFGKAIKGIFTDEPHRGALMDGFGMGNEEGHWHAPWTYALFDRFRETYGYDLVPKLPELFLQPEGRVVSQVKWHYVDLLQEMFQDSFAKPIQEWCTRHGIQLTGHILHEDRLAAQTAMVGSVMRFYEHMDVPGVDVLSEGNLNYWVVKQLSSAARQLGKKWLLSELYGCTGWQMPFEGHKAVGDWETLFGINLRCHHLSWYTMQGEAKRDYPASISFQSAWWRDYAAVETYFSRLGVLLTEGGPHCELLVLNPIESAWCQIHPGWSRGLGARSEAHQKLESLYQQTFHWLAGAQLDFDYGDEEMMSRLAAVETDKEGRTVLRIGQMSYRTVLVTGALTIRRSTLALLKPFAEQGGRLIFAGDAPDYLDALPSEEAKRLAASAVQVPFAEADLLQACRAAVRTDVTATDARTGEPIREIFAQVRESDEAIVVVLMNMNREKAYNNIRLHIQASGSLEEWIPLTGERRRVEVFEQEAGVSLVADFPPVGERVYVIAKSAQAAPLPLASRTQLHSVAPINGPYAYRLDEPNVCVLDSAAVRIDGGDWKGPMEILRADRHVRQYYGLPYRSGSMIQPWYAQKFRQQGDQESKGRIELAFTFTIEQLPTSAIWLAVERPELHRIRINDSELRPEQVRDGWWVDPAFVKLRLAPQLLRTGDNRIVLEADFHAGLDLEAIYLLGEFGVRLNGSQRIIDHLPETIAEGCLTRQGLPFYGGTVTYVLHQEQLREAVHRLGQRTADSQCVLQLPQLAAACIRLRTADGREQLLPWQPFESANLAANEAGTIELDVVLTRRNTFGPLHQLPLLTPNYGPGNWLTGGERFSEEYVLHPSGLLQAPQAAYKVPVDSGDVLTV